MNAIRGYELVVEWRKRCEKILSDLADANRLSETRRTKIADLERELAALKAAHWWNSKIVTVPAEFVELCKEVAKTDCMEQLWHKRKRFREQVAALFPDLPQEPAEPELKACPCGQGGCKIHTHEDGEGRKSWIINCIIGNCPWRAESFVSEEHVVKLWNRRATPEAKP